MPVRRASSHAFQKGDMSTAEDRMNATLGQSTMTGYIGIDGREGLVKVGKRLIRGSFFHLMHFVYDWLR